jgi:hypothetical protein
MFEFRLRVLEAGPNSYLGIVEGLPEILVHNVTAGDTEADLVRALDDWMEGRMRRGETLLQLDDLPTIRTSVLVLSTSNH